MSDLPEGRVCLLCQEYKAWDQFHRKPAGKFGRNSRCITCVSQQLRVKRSTRKCISCKVERPLSDYPEKTQARQCTLCRDKKEELSANNSRASATRIRSGKQERLEFLLNEAQILQDKISKLRLELESPPPSPTPSQEEEEPIYPKITNADIEFLLSQPLPHKMNLYT